MKRCCLTLLVAIATIPYYLTAQVDKPTIMLVNASFEDIPQHSRQPSGWNDCGFAGESSPDTQPNNEFAVTKPAAHGMTYLGMVVRDNDTYESVSQRLTRPLTTGDCYSFSIMLARSEKYVSLSRRTEEVVNYDTPAKLRIYGGFGHCDRRELLGESDLVTNFGWAEFQFKLEPGSNYTYLVLEAYYDTPVLFPYNGNLLVDGASGLQPVACSEPLPEPESEPVAINEPPVQEQTITSPGPSRGDQPALTPTPSPQPSSPSVSPNPGEPAAAPTTIADLNKDNVREGITLRMDKLFFDADKATIRRGSESGLQELYRFLKDNPKVVIEIGGHTNGLPEPEYCDKLSNDRARTVSNYLRDRGIPDTQLQYKGYGKRFPIASDDTIEGRRKNQRVEIKILEVGRSN